MEKKSVRITKKAVLYLFVLILLVCFVFPFFWMIRTSLMEINQIFQLPPVFIPDPLVLAELSRSLQHFPLAAVYRKLFYHQYSFCSRFGIHQFPVRFRILQNPVETAERNFYRSALQHDASLCRYHHSHLLGLERRGRRGYLLAPDSPLLVRRRSHVYLLAAPVLSVYSKGTG